MVAALTKRRGHTALMIFYICVVFQTHFAFSDILSASSLETCTRDGSDASLQLDCQQKMVVLLSLDSSNQLATEELQFTVGCVGR